MRKRQLIGTIAVVLVIVLVVGGGSLAERGTSPPLVDHIARDQPSTANINLTSVASSVSYQGLLTNDQGEPLTGAHDLRFELHQDAVAESMLWFQTVNDQIVTDGLVDVLLDVDPEDINGQALWLEIAVDGQVLAPRQEILPAPYALSLRPGAQLVGDEYAGLTSTTSNSYGVVGVSSQDSMGAGLLGENEGGHGDGVQGGSNGRSGVFGIGEGADSFGGYFMSLQDVGLYASGANDARPDVVLGANGPDDDDGLLTSELALPGSDLVLASNDMVIVALDDNMDEDSAFVVVNGDDQGVFAADEDGDVWFPGDLSLDGTVESRGHLVDRYYVDEDGAYVIPVPDYCIDGLCEVYVATDANMGAFGPGFMWPVMCTQSSDSDTWLGGPSISMGGVYFTEGMGENGDGIAQYIYVGGTTNGGGYVNLADDSAIESESDKWTIVFEAVPGELDWAEIWIVPIGVARVPEVF